MGWTELGSRVRRERKKRRQTQAAFAQDAGISPRTLRSIETGEWTHYSQDTLHAIEIAMRWQTGSVDRVIEGRRPIPEHDIELDQLHAVWPDLSLDARRLLVQYAEGARRQD